MKITVKTISEQHQALAFSNITTILISFHKLSSLAHIELLLSTRLTAYLSTNKRKNSINICLIYQQILQQATLNPLLTTKLV